MNIYDDRLGYIGRGQQRIPSPFDPSAGFCTLCWRRTESQTINDRIFVKKRGKFVEVVRPPMNSRTLEQAKDRLQEIRAAAKGEDPNLVGSLLYDYAREHGHKVLRDHGIDSTEATEMLLDVIERHLIEEEWLTTKTPFVVARKQFKGQVLHGETEITGLSKTPLKPSTLLCAEHNPRRSIEARRRYQNDLRRKDDFHETIRELTRHYISQCRPIHTVEHRTTVRREAYELVCMTTLEMVTALQAKGITNQAEIGRKLGLSRKAISLALARERQRSRQSS